MIWPAFFFSFLLSRLFLINTWFALGGLPLLAGLYWYFLRKDNYSHMRAISVLLAILSGGAYSGYLEKTMANAPDATSIIRLSQTAKIIQQSARSVVVSYSDKQGQIARARLTGLKKNHGFFKGDMVKFECEPREITNPGTFNFLENRQKILSPCRVIQVALVRRDEGIISQFRFQATQFLQERMQVFGEESLAAGFLLGDTDEIPAYRLEMFRKMGIAHLFAASGLHLGLLFALFYLPLSRTRAQPLGKAIAFVACLAFLMLLNFPVSLLRAFLFVSLHLFFQLIDRKISGINILFITAVIIEVAYPLSTFTPAFILSFGVTAAIILLYSPIRKILRFSSRLLSEQFALTFSAFAASVFLSWFMFGSSSPFSFVYNFLLVPLSGIYLASVLVAIFLPGTAIIATSIEKIFNLTADLHLNYWDTFFPVQNSLFTNIYLLLFALFLIYIGYYLVREHHWKARYRFIRMFPLFILAAPVLYIGVNQPGQAYRVFPYGAVVYHNETLNYYGVPAKFIDTKESTWYQRPCAPLREIVNYSAFETKDIQRHSGLLSVSAAPRESTLNGMLKAGPMCFVYFSRMKPERWATNKLQGCDQLHMVLGKKDKVKGTNWLSFFRSFGYKGKSIQYDSYYTNSMKTLGGCR